MNEYLYMFGFEAPIQRLQNDRYDLDHEDSYAIFVLAKSAEEALKWGRVVSEAFCRYLYQESGWTGTIPSWKDDGFAHWIEEDDESDISAAREWGAPRVEVGEIPDFRQWPDVV